MAQGNPAFSTLEFDRPQTKGVLVSRLGNEDLLTICHLVVRPSVVQAGSFARL
jgi:hypothetical protein